MLNLPREGQRLLINSDEFSIDNKKKNNLSWEVYEIFNAKGQGLGM